MMKIIILIVAILAISALLEILRGKEKETKKYQYARKDFFMTRAEHECYDALVIAVGEKYHIFPQVSLPSIVDNKIVGQNWKAAFRHVSQLSVDFVLCDKTHLSPKLAIELDDKSHEQLDRMARDIEVERILKEASLALLRLENHGSFNSHELTEKIAGILASTRE